MEEPKKDTESYRDKIATVDKTGKRNWIYPKKPKGYYYDFRKWVSYVLLIFLFGIPHLKINGESLLLFNILERKFIIFGLHFAPQDFHLFVLAMLIFIIFISLFTVVFGRLFCGWVCPQTIFMEMVFRRIEYWIEGDANAQKRLNKAPWDTDKVIKKVGKQIIFFGIAIMVANTFLSYIIGVDEVWKIATEPMSLHMQGFFAMLFFSFLFYYVFSQMREQVCVTICPYGRLQGVLLDKDSIAVYYDFERGEPRGKIKKKRNVKQNTKANLTCLDSSNTCSRGDVCKNDANKYTDNVLRQIEEGIKLGDCIDCKLCVQVCPTGIDIRNGIQLECVNCTACIDACDEVMEKISRPKGLIRYDSYNGIINKGKPIFTPRVIAYSVVLSLLMIVEIFLLASRSDVESLFFRVPGMLYQRTEQGDISNLYNYQLINKTTKDFPIEFELLDSGKGKIRLVGDPPVSLKDDVTEGVLFIDIPPDELESRKTRITISVQTDGKEIDQVKTTFLGPVK